MWSITRRRSSSPGIDGLRGVAKPWAESAIRRASAFERSDMTEDGSAGDLTPRVICRTLHTFFVRLTAGFQPSGYHARRNQDRLVYMEARCVREDHGAD